MLHRVLQRAQPAHPGRPAAEKSSPSTEGFDRVFRRRPGGIHGSTPRCDVSGLAAFDRYLETIPQGKRVRPITYTVKDVVGAAASASARRAARLQRVVEGFNQALENDVVLSMKQGERRRARPRRDRRADPRSTSTDHGHRTADSQRALQAHADPYSATPS